MNNQIASVRQNLDLIVDHGAAVPGLASQNSVKWGKTLGGTFNVWRSGLGVTKSGAIIYVGGPSLSISDLANVLVRAGAVRGMELDINTDWVQFSAYTGALNTPINGGNGSCNGGNATCLLSSMNGPPSRYFATWWSRDFFTMTLRAGETDDGAHDHHHLGERLAVSHLSPDRRREVAEDREDVAQQGRAPDHAIAVGEATHYIVRHFIDARREGSVRQSRRHL